MDVQWNLIWKHSNEIASNSGKNDPLADPLERAEWQGLGWTAPLISRVVSGIRPGGSPEEKMQHVERFTIERQPDSVCVS